MAPEFGDIIEGIHASPLNPQKRGVFVEIIRRRGRMNPGTFYRLTDGRGSFWEYPEESCINISKKDMLKGGS